MAAGFMRLSRLMHVISAFWVLVIAGIIFVDVTGRVLFNAPLTGASEIIRNSVVAIAFLQLPLAILTGSHLRTTLLMGLIGPWVRRVLRTFGFLLGVAFFVGVVVSAWDDMILAWRIGEYEGEGALRVPTYPVRTLMVVTSCFAALAYSWMIWLDWTDRLYGEQSAIPPHLDHA